MEPCDVVIPDSELNLKGCSRLRHSACFFKSPSSSAVTERLLPAGQDKELGLKNDLYVYIKPVLICPLLFLYLQCYYWRYRYSYLLSNWRPLSSRPNTSCFVRNSRQSEQPVFTKFIVGIDPGGHTHAHTQTHTHTHTYFKCLSADMSPNISTASFINIWTYSPDGSVCLRVTLGRTVAKKSELTLDL